MVSIQTSSRFNTAWNGRSIGLKLKAADFNLQGVVHLYWICVPAFLVRLTEISSDLEAAGSRPDLVSLGQGHRGRSH